MLTIRLASYRVYVDHTCTAVAPLHIHAPESFVSWEAGEAHFVLVSSNCARVPSELINCFSVKRMISPCRLIHHLTASMPLEWILRPSVACRKRKRSCSFLAYLSSIILVKIRNRTYGPSRSRLLTHPLSRRANPS